MTTIGIVGQGIVGLSLAFHLSRNKNKIKNIVLFNSEDFAPTCSYSSTSVASLRGTTRGHSPLGDLIVEGFEAFGEHIKKDSPDGVVPIWQFNGASEFGNEFLKRFPQSLKSNIAGEVRLKKEFQISKEKAFMVIPERYLPWLLEASQKNIEIKLIHDFILKYEKDSKVKLFGQSGKEYVFDKVIFATGASSRFWRKSEKAYLPLESSKPVQGTYLEFNDVSLPIDSFSLTLNGNNLVYRKQSQQVLIGASSIEVDHFLAQKNDLHQMHHFFQDILEIDLPDFQRGILKVGLREKAKKRTPYMIQDDQVYYLGGLYKNGFSLSYHLTEKLTHQMLESV